MFTHLPLYRVLVCQEHQRAVYNPDEHLKRHHRLPAAQRRELLAPYKRLTPFPPPDQVPVPQPYGAAIAALGQAQDGFLCRTGSCCFATASRSWMKKHVNKQHHT
jgi:hypothetical protein